MPPGAGASRTAGQAGPVALPLPSSRWNVSRRVWVEPGRRRVNLLDTTLYPGHRPSSARTTVYHPQPPLPACPACTRPRLVLLNLPEQLLEQVCRGLIRGFGLERGDPM
jgi:hypothetical protein